MEILTFWKPEFGPTIEPLYGTRDKSFAGPQDFFRPGAVVVQRANEITIFENPIWLETAGTNSDFFLQNFPNIVERCVRQRHHLRRPWTLA